MNASRSSLPEYAHPPLVAATLGVFYQSPLEFSSSTLADFQQKLGAEWVGDWRNISSDNVNVRTDVGLLTMGQQLQNVLGDRILRVSPMHFAFTWLDATNGRYPRYENLRDGFVGAWDTWLSQQRISAGGLWKWAVCYANCIPQGTVWQTPADWSFFKLLPSSGAFAERITNAHWQLRLPDLPDGLSIAWTVAAPVDDSPPAAWVRLTACGRIEEDASTLLDGMDAGRAAIVQTFGELMSPAANAYWGLRRREK